MIKKLFSPFLQLLKESKKKLLLMSLPYLLSFLLFTRIAELFRLCNKDIMLFSRNISYIYKTIPNWNNKDMLFGICITGLIGFYIYSMGMDKKQFRHGEEYGSARWGTAEDIKPYVDPDFFNNMIFSRTEYLTMNPKMKVFKYNRNKNVAIYGGSGSGKTYGIVKPNLLQMHSSYVLTDPKGTLLPETGTAFARHGYRIKVLDTIDFANSMHYNPFKYIKEEKDILTLANTLLINMKGEDAGAAQDPFWDKAALLWLQAIISFIWYEAPEEERNMSTLIEMLNASEVKEDDEEFMNAVDCIFEELEKKEPNHFSIRQYKKYKLAAGKTAKSILITLGAMFSPFDIKEVRDLMMYDELDFDTYGDADQKTILYVIIPDTDKTFNFIPAILFTQMFNTLCYKADKEYGGKLKTSVMFILDEFANVGKIPRFEILIATIRSRLISAVIILQTQSQLKGIYKDHAETIIGNCDTTIFLGGKEKTTLKDLEEALGDQTIDLFNESESYSQTRSTSRNGNKVGRKLKNIFELNTMDRDKCIVQISGLPPFFSDKYDTSQHQRFRDLADYDQKNLFDMAAYKTKLRKKQEILRKKTEKENLLRLTKEDVFEYISLP